MNKYYKINKVAKLTSVSIRTLRYYDEINLLKPEYRTSSGHRFYSEGDLLKLQQIMTFKFMGFSLTNIQQILKNPNFNIHESLKIQASELSKEALRIDKMSKLLNYLVEYTEQGNSIDWNSINKMTEILQLSENDRKTWYEKYLAPTELSEFKKSWNQYSDVFWQDYHRRWKKLFEEVRKNLITDPESDIGLKLAKKWLLLIEEVHGKNQSHLRHQLSEAYKAGIIPSEQVPYDKDIISYITKAIKRLHQLPNSESW